jgi:hypothetical protein
VEPSLCASHLYIDVWWLTLRTNELHLVLRSLPHTRFRPTHTFSSFESLEFFKYRAIALIFLPFLPKNLNESLLFLEGRRIIKYWVVFLLCQSHVEHTSGATPLGFIVDQSLWHYNMTIVEVQNAFFMLFQLVNAHLTEVLKVSRLCRLNLLLLVVVLIMGFVLAMGGMR